MSELKTLEKCTQQLETALKEVERDLVHVLLKECLISSDVHEDVLEPRTSLNNSEKAGELVKSIKNRVKQDPSSYHTLIDELKRRGRRYEPIVKILEEEYNKPGKYIYTVKKSIFVTPQRSNIISDVSMETHDHPL
jgi:septal ring factor EnvC (AmiA/AmiB activator)